MVLRDKFHTKSPGFSSLNRFLVKTEMKKSLNNKVKIPKFISFQPAQYINNREQYLKEIKQKLNLPIFTKPTNSVGSCNTFKVTSVDALREWADNHKHENNFELD